MKAHANTIPLAPPAPLGPALRTRRSRTSSWASWLSPRIPRPARPSERNNHNESSDTDDEGGSPRSSQQQRPRRASFDQTNTANNAAQGRLNKERGGESYFKSSALFSGRSAAIDACVSKSIESEDVSLVTMSHSADDEIEKSHSLLTAFLLHLNSLLPLYCEHLCTTADTLHSISGASKAVSLLEKGAKTLSMTFGATKSSSATFTSSPTIKGEMRSSLPTLTRGITDNSTIASSAPSSPSYQQQQGRSPLKKLLSPKSDSATSSPLKLVTPDLRHWLYPLSPRSSRDSQERSQRTKISPKKRSSQQKSGMKWNARAESEWERFVSPFLNLAGAECFYARMEHVVDPRRVEEDLDSGGEKVVIHGSKEGTSSSFVKFAAGQPGSDQMDQAESSKDATRGKFIRQGDGAYPPLASPTDANKRGSRRLISMYSQIREDLIIVGEYLCDPVIGAHVGGSAASRDSKWGSKSVRLPPPPLNLGTPSSSAANSRSSSPVKSSGSPRKSSGNEQKSNDIDKYTAHEQREFAAISLRNTLDALISFIDGRCILIRIHAELCCPSPPLHSLGELGYGSGLRDQGSKHVSEGRSRKWIALSEQCRSVMQPISAWAKEFGCTRVVSNIEKELKMMELALLSIHHMFECSVFNCVVNVRRLHVLQGKTTDQKTCLPIMYIRSSLPALLAMMHIYFSGASTGLEMLRSGQSLSSQSSSTPKSSGLTTNRRSFNNLEDASTKKLKKSKSIDLTSFFAEFIARNANNGLPLAVAVVHRMGGRGDSTSEEQQGEDFENNEHSDSACWDPLYIKSTLHGSSVGTSTDSFFKLRSQGGTNLVKMIKENFSTDRDTDAKTCKTKDKANRAKTLGGDTSWPFQYWGQIEKVLTEHCSVSGTTDSVKYNIESVDSRAVVSNNDVDGKIQRNQSRVLPQCHISSITDAISLVVMQGAGHAKRHRASDDDIHFFGRTMVTKLSPENLLSIKDVIRLKSELFPVNEDTHPDKSEVSTSSNNNVPTTSLWSESGWSDSQRKKILHSLGLRRKNSPVTTPLKSPYVKRQIRGNLGRQRKKKTKNSINHGHIDFFLGPELSQLLK